MAFDLDKTIKLYETLTNEQKKQIDRFIYKNSYFDSIYDARVTVEAYKTFIEAETYIKNMIKHPDDDDQWFLNVYYCDVCNKSFGSPFRHETMCLECDMASED